MELLELLELKPGCSPLCAMRILRKYSSMHRRGTGELHCTESSYHPAEQRLLATSERLAIKVQRIVIDRQHFMSKRNNQSYRLFNLPPHEPTAWAVALLRVDPTRGSETGTVRGLRWHTLRREGEGGVGEVRIGQTRRGRAQGGERPLGTAAFGGRGFKGRARVTGERPNRRRPLQTAIHAGIMPSPPHPLPTLGVPSTFSCLSFPCAPVPSQPALLVIHNIAVRTTSGKGSATVRWCSKTT